MIHDIALEVEQEFGRPNLSEIAKRAHCDRKTVRKYLDSRNLPVVIKKRETSSKLLEEFRMKYSMTILNISHKMMHPISHW